MAIMGPPEFVKDVPPWVLGDEWPNGDEDAMHRLARVWQTAAADIGAAMRAAEDAVRYARGDAQGPSARRFDEFLAKFADGDDAAFPALLDGANQLADACRECALRLEHAKLTIRAALAALMLQTISMTAAAYVTGGASLAGIRPARLATRQVVLTVFTDLVDRLGEQVDGTLPNRLLRSLAAEVTSAGGRRPASKGSISGSFSLDLVRDEPQRFTGNLDLSPLDLSPSAPEPEPEPGPVGQPDPDVWTDDRGTVYASSPRHRDLRPVWPPKRPKNPDETDPDGGTGDTRPPRPTAPEGTPLFFENRPDFRAGPADVHHMRQSYPLDTWYEDAAAIDRIIADNPQFQHIPRDQLVALRGHTAPHTFKVVNEALRTNDIETLRRYEGYIKVVNSALNQLPPWHGVVHRVIESAHPAARASQFRFDAEITERAFLAGAAGGPSRFPGKVVIQIHSLTGRDISALAHRPRERTVLFPAGTRFKVIGTGFDQRTGTHYVQLREIPAAVARRRPRRGVHGGRPRPVPHPRPQPRSSVDERIETTTPLRRPQSPPMPPVRQGPRADAMPADGVAEPAGPRTGEWIDGDGNVFTIHSPAWGDAVPAEDVRQEGDQA